MPSRPRTPPDSIVALVERFDPGAFDLHPRGARLRLTAGEDAAWDALLSRDGARLVSADGAAPDGELSADEQTWVQIAEDVGAGMEAFRRGRLTIRRDLHLGVGFLAATNGSSEPGRLEVRRVRTAAGALSTLQAGAGKPIIAVHGLGGTKASFLPTLAALAPSHRVVALDLPGFGDSVKPIGAPYHAPFFARAVTALMDALEIERAHIVGNSLGGRVALELGMRAADRTDRLALLSPSLAWLRSRRWAPALRLLRPELGLVQPSPRALVERLVRRVVPGADGGWVSTGVDEFLRAYANPRGRAAFYAAARQIYLEEPHGANGFWTRLAGLTPESLFVWGKSDGLVPISFARHVERVLPDARHVELDCGHVPQLERPRETHAALIDFLV